MLDDDGHQPDPSHSVSHEDWMLFHPNALEHLSTGRDLEDCGDSDAEAAEAFFHLCQQTVWLLIVLCVIVPAKLLTYFAKAGWRKSKARACARQTRAKSIN